MMNYYDEEYYNEPSEFEMMIEEFKSTLANSIKEEHKSQMEELKKENAELQEIKMNFEEIKREYADRKRKLEWEYEDKKRNVRRERLGELMKDYEVELYTVASRSYQNPKCDKCDERRRIYYKTPLGRNEHERCTCDTKTYIYEPIKTMLYTFSFRNGEASAWYKVKGDRYDEYLCYEEDSVHGKELITSEDQFENAASSYKTLFANKEIAQKYCDYKNNKTK